MNKKQYKNRGTFVRLTDNEMMYLQILKNKHYINISALFRKTISDLYNKLEKNDE